MTDVELAALLMKAGAPWLLVHCGLCGAAMPRAGHVCEPRAQVLRGIASVR